MDWSSILSYTVSEVQAREEVTDSVYAFMVKVSKMASPMLL